MPEHAAIYFSSPDLWKVRNGQILPLQCGRVQFGLTNVILKYTRYGMVFQKVFNLVAPLNLWAKEVESVIMTFSLQYI